MKDTFILIQPSSEKIAYATYELNNEFAILSGIVGMGADYDMNTFRGWN